MAIFGTAEGTSAAIGDMQNLARTQGIQAQTQGQQLQNAQAQQTMQQQQQMMALSQKEAADPEFQAKSPVEKMEDMAQLAFKSGLTATGSALVKDAAEIRLKGAQASHAQAQTINQQALQVKTHLETVEKLLNGVTDQGSWETANSLYEQMTGTKSPFAGMDYNPAIVQQLQQQTLSLKDQINLGIKKYNAETQRNNSDSASSFRDFRKGYLKDELDLRRQREARLQKSGGKASDVGVPVKSELDHAADLITRTFPDLPTDEVNNAAYTIASRARALRKSTPGMDADTATERAIAEAKSGGQFQSLNDAYKVFGVPIPGTNKTTTHFTKGGGKGQGATATNPFSSIPAPKERQVGSFYSHNGKTYKWSTGGWEAVDAGDAED